MCSRARKVTISGGTFTINSQVGDPTLPITSFPDTTSLESSDLTAICDVFGDEMDYSGCWSGDPDQVQRGELGDAHPRSCLSCVDHLGGFALEHSESMIPLLHEEVHHAVGIVDYSGPKDAIKPARSPLVKQIKPAVFASTVPHFGHLECWTEYPSLVICPLTVTRS
ncbi:hypothetical protein DFH09DRAFT_1472246 [Mycena vulgaris]|nr:hypothetical protein DFH09DRAFT_1472246 [Mycena vulgaris]